MKTLLSATALAVILSAAAPAFASSDDNRCGATDRSQWMSIEAIAKKAREHGYEPREIEIDDGCYEVKTRRDGQRVEVKLHPVTGNVVKVEYDD